MQRAQPVTAPIAGEDSCWLSCGLAAGLGLWGGVPGRFPAGLSPLGPAPCGP